MRRLALPVLLALAACGQKGNLYLPDDSVEMVPASTAPAGSIAPAQSAAPATQPPATPDAAPAPEDPDRDNPGSRRN